jgi:hypothetical protein
LAIGDSHGIERHWLGGRKNIGRSGTKIKLGEMLGAFNGAFIGPDDSIRKRIVRMTTSISYRVERVSNSDDGDTVTFNVKPSCFSIFNLVVAT